MKDVHLPDSTGSELQAKATLNDNTIELRLTGTADMRSGDQLARLIAQIDAVSVREKCQEVVINLGELEFMNSSCFKTLVSWINEVQSRSVEKRHKICFRSNQSMLWQRRSLHALQCFAPDLVRITPC